ncbi:MAG: hypothetical protein WBG92_18275 [Thiohalocapsa sp.]
MQVNPRALLLFGMAAAGAAWLAASASALSYQDQLLGVAVRQSFGDAAAQIAPERPEIQALLLDYADDEPLMLKARSALLRYPDRARRLLPIYGAASDFQDVLSRYGEAVVLPIAYFIENDLTSLELRHALHERWRELQEMASPLIQDRPATVGGPAQALTRELQGWYAINFLREDGYDFLGQFTITPDGSVHWLQTERFLEGLSGFFLGAIRDLETKWQQEEEIVGSDLAWAALDVALIATTAKLVRGVRVAKAVAPGVNGTKAEGFSGRVALFGSNVLARSGRLGVAVARYGAVPAAVYLMIRYPSLINATLAELASWLGAPPRLVQFLFWLAALWVALRLALLLLRPLSAALRALGSMAGTLATWPQSKHS